MNDLVVGSDRKPMKITDNWITKAQREALQKIADRPGHQYFCHHLDYAVRDPKEGNRSNTLVILFWEADKICYRWITADGAEGANPVDRKK